MTTEPLQVQVYLPTLHPSQHEVATSKARMRVVCCGRRWGKTMLGVVECIRVGSKGGRAWWIAPSYSIALEGWRYLTRVVATFPNARVEVSRLRVSFSGGGSIEIKTADNPDNLRGAGLDLAVLDEAASMQPDVWYLIIRPALADRGGRALFISTPKHFNWFYDIYAHAEQDTSGTWACWQHPTWDNPFIPQTEVDQAQRDMQQGDFDQEFGASFTAVGGAIWPALSANRPMYLRPMPKDLIIKATGIGMDWGCLTLDTQILTREGWKAHDELQVGEQVAALDRITESLRWTPLRAVVYKPNQPLAVLESKSFEFTATVDHSWAVRRSRHLESRHQNRHGYWPLERKRLDEIREDGCLKTGHQLILAAPMKDGCDYDCTPAEAAVLGWIVTDGNIQGEPWGESKSSVVISQKNHVPELLNDLEESGLAYSEMAMRSWGVRQWRLSSPVARDFMLRMHYRGKESLPRIVLALGPEHRQRMLQAMLVAEGHKQAGAWVFTQADGPVWESFLLLAALCGKRLNRVHEKLGGFTGRPLKRVSLSLRPNLAPRVRDAGMADTWCPSVDEGFIVARQGDQIAVTGNTTPAHHAAVICASRTSTGSIWIRSAWTSPSGNSRDWYDEARRARKDYGATFARVDRSQSSAIDILEAPSSNGGCDLDADKGIANVEARIGDFTGLITSSNIFWDLHGPGVRDYYNHCCTYHRDDKGKVVEELDDDVDAGCYVVSELVKPSPLAYTPPTSRLIKYITQPVKKRLRSA